VKANRIISNRVRLQDGTAALVFVPRDWLAANGKAPVTGLPSGFYFMRNHREKHSGEVGLCWEYPQTGVLRLDDMKLHAECGEIDVDTYELAVAVDMEDRL